MHLLSGQISLVVVFLRLLLVSATSALIDVEGHRLHHRTIKFPAPSGGYS